MTTRRTALAGSLLMLMMAATAPRAHAEHAEMGPGEAVGITVVVLGYAADVVGFAASDLASNGHGRTYGGVELALNAPLAAAYTKVGVDEAPPGLLFAMSATHAALAIHGAWTLADPSTSSRAALVGGALYASEVDAFVAHDLGAHGGAYDIAELGVNAPIAAGLGYLAYEEIRDRHGGEATMLGVGAALSAALAIHGLHDALAGGGPQRYVPRTAGLAVMPMAVSDGLTMGIGLGASGAL